MDRGAYPIPIYNKKTILDQIDKVNREGPSYLPLGKDMKDIELRLLNIELVLAKMQSLQSSYWLGADKP